MATTLDSDVDRKKLSFQPQRRSTPPQRRSAIALIRVALGLILVPHGYAKLFLDDAVPASRNFVHFGWAYPLAWAYFIGVIEFFGGLMLAVGLFTRIVAAAIAIEMAVISFAVLYPVWSWGKHGMEYALLMGVHCTRHFPGRWRPHSLDRVIGVSFNDVPIAK